MFLLLVAVSVSYWYCLPIWTQSVVRYSEFRLYDVLLALLLVIVALAYRQNVAMLLRRDVSGRWLWRFTLWATATFPVTIAVVLSRHRPDWILVTLTFLFHLWGFVCAYFCFRLFVNTRQRAYRLLDTFLVVGTIEAVLICLQGLEVLPQFWGELYSSYGTDAYSATLGPNRQLPGHAMLLVFAVAAAYWRNRRTVGTRRTVLAGVAAAAALPALGMTGSRTAWVATAVFVVAMVAWDRGGVGLVAFLALVGAGALFVLPKPVEDRVSEIYDYRLASRLAATGGEDAVTRFRSVDSGRFAIWKQSLKVLARKPWLIPFGGGINNFSFVIRVDSSAHNTYINLIAEVGVVGLVLYLRWLWALWKESSELTRISRRWRRRGRRVFVPTEVRALVLALAVALLAGEVVYPYRPAFAFMGMVLFVYALLTNRALIFGGPLPVRSAIPRRALSDPLALRGVR